MARRLLAIVALLLALRSAPASGGCSFNWDVDCGAYWETTVVLGFDDDGLSGAWAGAGEYDAEVVFHWGVGNETSLGIQRYNASEWHEETGVHQFLEEGRHAVGASIIYGEGAECEGQTIERCWEVDLNGGGCDVLEVVDCPSTPPVRAPTDPPGLTAAPTLLPTTATPSNPWTVRPTTAQPSENTTVQPTTAEPSGSPSVPSEAPTTRLATVRPTDSPTETPTTNNPMTASPTRNPNISPTTDLPSERPTERPTARPTERPSAQPTARPSAQPTETPTETRTEAPTALPTDKPSARPTERPTEPPTTEVPTVLPTDNPTERPSARPTERPTSRPTAWPTEAPTEAPTERPTERPTARPSPRPTARPTKRPTARPTMRPTEMPTALPTETPTLRPTTARPTKWPTARPTLRPTERPTARPTEKPTLRPTTAWPTKRPTARPTLRPTTWPTRRPTALPTLRPTARPTMFPTINPTLDPTLAPTEDPTTAAPTRRPTPLPTTATPSEPPTEPPTTAEPSDLPTVGPTTAEPSGSPTVGPTTAAPSAAPTVSPTTARPSDAPTLRPSRSPQTYPTTDPPSKSPTMRPTVPPTVPPSVPPTVPPTTAAPSGGPTASPSTSPPTTDYPTIQPSPGQSRAGFPRVAATQAPSIFPESRGSASPPTPAQVTDTPSAPEATAATAFPTPAPADALEENVVACEMVLYFVDPMDDGMVRAWEDITASTILDEAVDATGLGPESITVVVRFDGQRPLSSSARRGVGDGDVGVRHLQTPSALEIDLTAAMQLPSGGSRGGNASEVVASAFRTFDKQRAYIQALKLEDSHFEYVNEMTMTCGTALTETNTRFNVLEQDEVRRGDGGNSSRSRPHPIGLAISAVTGGAAILLCAFGILYMRRNKPWEAIEDNSASSSCNAAAREEGGEPPVDANAPLSDKTKSAAPTNAPSELREGLLRIESQGGDCDDVSTLDGPHFGDGRNLAVDGNTVDESLVSTDQGLYVYGVKKQTGIGGGQTVGASTMSPGTQGFTFGADTHLEESYDNFSPGASTEGVDHSNLTQFSVVAPSGQLGIVLDNPCSNLPTIIAIKETSVLRESVIMGDYLLSVDGVDCTSMTAHALSAFLHGRRDNPERTLLLARFSGTGHAAVPV